MLLPLLIWVQSPALWAIMFDWSSRQKQSATNEAAARPELRSQDHTVGVGQLLISPPPSRVALRPSSPNETEDPPCSMSRSCWKRRPISDRGVLPLRTLRHGHILCCEPPHPLPTCPSSYVVLFVVAFCLNMRQSP